MKEGGMSGTGFSSPMDIFDMFFGGGFGGRGRRRERRGQDVMHQLSVSLEELYKGTLRKLALQKNVICDKCEGNYLKVTTVNGLFIHRMSDDKYNNAREVIKCIEQIRVIFQTSLSDFNATW